MRLGDERSGSPIRVCQLPCHERGEVLFDGLKVASDPPGKAFVSKFAKPTQEALSTFLGGRNQPDLHSRIHACTLVGLGSWPSYAQTRHLKRGGSPAGSLSPWRAASLSHSSRSTSAGGSDATFGLT